MHDWCPKEIWWTVLWRLAISPYMPPQHASRFFRSHNPASQCPFCLSRLCWKHSRIQTSQSTPLHVRSSLLHVASTVLTYTLSTVCSTVLLLYDTLLTFNREIELAWKPVLRFILDRRLSKNTTREKLIGLRILIPVIRYPMIISGLGSLFCRFLSVIINIQTTTSSSW